MVTYTELRKKVLEYQEGKEFPSCRQSYISLISLTQQIFDLNEGQEKQSKVNDLAKASYSILVLFKLHEVASELSKKTGSNSKSLTKALVQFN